MGKILSKFGIMLSKSNLLSYRTNAGLTIVELSKLANVSKDIISRIERNNYPYKNGPNLLTLKKIYSGLRKELPDLTFDELFPGQEEKIAS